MKARTTIMAVAATAMLLIGCGQKENTNKPKTEMSQQANASKEAYPEEFFEVANDVLDTYLIYDGDLLAERMQMGSEMADVELRERKETAQEMAAEAVKLHKSCKALLKARKMKELHDTMYDNWQTFIASPNANIEDEDMLIQLIMSMAKVEYPNDSIRFYTENEQLLDWHATHFWMLEMLGGDEIVIPDDHVKTVLILMATRKELGKYDECIEAGEHLLQHLKQFAPQHEAILVLEDFINEVQGSKESNKQRGN